MKSVYYRIIFVFLNQDICCVYSKEPFEHPKHTFKHMIKKIIKNLRSHKFRLSGAMVIIIAEDILITSAYQRINFHISQPNQMLWVLKRNHWLIETVLFSTQNIC